MTMPFATYRTAIKTWIEAQSGCTLQWRDDTGGWQSKPRIRAHLHDSAARGVDFIEWDYDDTQAVGSDYVPTVRGNRSLILTLRCETRDQSGNTTAGYFLEKVRTSAKKPSVRSGLYAGGLVIERMENVIDFEDSTQDGRVESWAYLDVHLSAVVNDRDETEGDSYVDHMTATGSLTTPADEDAGPGEEEYP